MRLKKIELVGFKSFADKASLEFNSGITGIVGPNGCGKSNISDAFRWVLGEQSTKLRGTKMPDVIFAGTTSRKPLNFAEVTLTFNEIAGRLPTEYEEIAITRRLHRCKNGESGESDYFINKRPVRLKEIHDLFLDSGIGKNAFSIFEQGKIDQIIQFSPLERRYIFEEAAGIIRFLNRKKEALRKLEQTELNISRIRDIQSEIEKQISVLQIQAEKAENYWEVKRKLEKLELSLLFNKWNNCEKKLTEISHSSALSEAKVHEKNSELSSLLTKQVETKEAFSIKEKGLLSKIEYLLKLTSQKQIQLNEHRFNQERISEIAHREKRMQLSIAANKIKQIERERESVAYREQKERIEVQITLQNELIQKLRIKINELEDKISHLRLEQQKSHYKQLKASQEEITAKNDLKQQENHLERTKERIRYLKDRQQNFVEQTVEFQKKLNARQEQLKEFLEKIEKKKNSIVDLDDQIKQISNQILQVQQKQKEIHHLLTENKARYKILLRLREELEGFSSSTKHLLQESHNKKSPLFNKLRGLYEYITPEKGFEIALALAMKPYVETLVVATKTDLEQVITYAKEFSLTDFSLVCWERVEKFQMEGKKEESKSKKTSSPFSSHCIQNLLSNHFLHHIALKEWKETLPPPQNASTMSNLENGSLYIDNFDVIFYAQKSETKESENNIFLREAEIKNLEDKITEEEIEKTKIDEELKKVQQDREQLHQNRQELDKALRKEEMYLIEINFDIQRSKSDLEKVEKQQKEECSELETAELSVEQLKNSIEKLHALYTSASYVVKEIHQQTSSLQSTIEEWSNQLKSHQKELRVKEEDHQKNSRENQRLTHALNLIEVQDKETIQEEKRLLLETQHGIEQTTSLQEKNKTFEESMAKLDNSLAEENQIKNSLEQELKCLQLNLEQIELKITQHRQILNQLERQLNNQAIQLAQVAALKLGIETDLQERYGKTIQEAQKLDLKLEKSMEQSEKELKQLRQEIENSSDINLGSVEELDKQRERCRFLNEQVSDLLLSKQDLVKIISELDSESRKAFKETFLAVQANFQKNFSILFDGGEADLKLTEAGDILEAGIEIIAKPPGKHMRSITLLSGGEKCLTAIALLFAIFEVKPSPFCILDEVDAPLDESNVGRFANIIRLFVDRCQFIIITHNKRTMSIADMLFGISMEERGISKVLSLEFAKK